MFAGFTYPEYGADLVSWRLQPSYNGEARYLPIWEKCQIHKCFTIKSLGATGDLCNVFNDRDYREEYAWSNSNEMAVHPDLVDTGVPIIPAPGVVVQGMLRAGLVGWLQQ